MRLKVSLLRSRSHCRILLDATESLASPVNRESVAPTASPDFPVSRVRLELLASLENLVSVCQLFRFLM